jgi:hypothetical protein
VRAHYTRPVTDQQGNLVPNVQVTVYNPATTVLVTEVLYSTDTGVSVLTNPFVSSTGIIDFYMNNPTRVRLGIIQGTLPVQYDDDVDVLAAGADSLHSGAGLDSLVIGVSASSAGDNSTAVGQGANSPGASSTALGIAASALGAQSIAVGSSSVQGTGAVGIGDSSHATGNQSVAIGQSATATLAEGVALGHGATAPHAHATAIGPGAATTGPNQVMLGTASDFTEIPLGSYAVMSSENGTRFKITVDDTGSLTTTVL